MFRVYAGRPILVALATRLGLPLFHGSPAKAERRRGVQHCKAARNLGVGAGEQPAAATCSKVAAIIQLGSRSDSIQFALLAGGCWISCAVSRAAPREGRSAARRGARERAKGPRATGCDVLVRLNIDTQRATCDDEAAAAAAAAATAAAAAAASDACPLARSLARFLHSLDSSQGYNCHRQLRTVATKRFEWFSKRKVSLVNSPFVVRRGKKKQEKKKKKRRVGTRREEHGGPSLRTAGNSAQPPPTGTSDESIDLGVGLKTPLSPAPLASARSLVAAPPPPCSSSALLSKGSLSAVLYARHSGLVINLELGESTTESDLSLFARSSTSSFDLGD
ncbi:hypothetical protein G5I_05327 [Acromyrmex echinatior]|uniref:Uncharacterized protein n=1 Tax=Acromyrmex echinatior TaxID=103372 RepID=F4WHY0_ACREC|nr:hypothetical protein G5I_05327 [Acromyrmex echinatior]